MSAPCFGSYQRNSSGKLHFQFGPCRQHVVYTLFLCNCSLQLFHTVKDVHEEEPSSTVEEITAPKPLHEHNSAAEEDSREPDGEAKRFRVFMRGENEMLKREKISLNKITII